MSDFHIEVDKAFDTIRMFIGAGGCGSPGCTADRKRKVLLYFQHGLWDGTLWDFMCRPELKLGASGEYEWLPIKEIEC